MHDSDNDSQPTAALNLARAGALRKAAAGGLELPVTGTSMEPNIMNGNTVKVFSNRPVRFGDVVAFVNSNGSVVVHRHIASARGWQISIGDNQPNFDSPVPIEHLVGLTSEPRVVLGHAGNTLKASIRLGIRRLVKLAKRQR